MFRKIKASKTIKLLLKMAATRYVTHRIASMYIYRSDWFRLMKNIYDIVDGEGFSSLVIIWAQEGCVFGMR